MCRKLRARGAGELRDDVDAVDVASEAGEKRRHVAAAGAHLQYPVPGRDRELLQHARLELGGEHRFAVTERDLHVGEREGAVAGRDELLAPHAQEQVENALVQNLPRPDLLLDHVEAGAFDVELRVHREIQKVAVRQDGCNYHIIRLA